MAMQIKTWAQFLACFCEAPSLACLFLLTKPQFYLGQQCAQPQILKFIASLAGRGGHMIQFPASNIQAEVPKEGLLGDRSRWSPISVHLSSSCSGCLLFQTIFSSMFERHTTLENRHTVSPEQKEGLFGTCEDRNHVSLQNKGQACLLLLYKLWGP